MKAPHQFTNNQKQMRNQLYEASVEKLEEKRSRLDFDIITGDKSWFYHNDPKIEKESKV